MFLNWSRNRDKPSLGRLFGTVTPSGGSRRSHRPQIELLEDRLVPTPIGGPISKPPIVIKPDQSATPPAGALTPAQLRHAYGIDKTTLGNVVGDGTGQTIAIIDAGDNPGFVSSTDPNFLNSDLHKFDLQFGLPDPPSFMKLNQEGQQSNYPPANASSFAGEEALDVEWSHAIAPQANIILIETNDATTPNLIVAGVNLAKSLPQVSAVSMSFGGPEASGQLALDPLFTTPAGHQGITFLASTGDTGAPGGYPAYSPNVVAVGGTTLTVDAAGNYLAETGWSLGSDSFNPALAGGGGISTVETQPAYQKGVVTQSTTFRTIPDVSFDADPNTGVAVYDSFDNGAATPWAQVGGTSLACPCWAGIIAIADQDRARFGLGTLDGATQTLPKLYTLPASDFHDILTGNNGFSAGPGYDLVTGIGTPIAQLLIPDLAGVSQLTSQTQKFHPFRYIVDAAIPQTATSPQSASIFTGNITLINTSQLNPTVQLLLVLGPLPAGVTLDSSVPTVTTMTGQVGIPLPIIGLPSERVVRLEIKLDNPNHVPISSFFEGFDFTLIPDVM